MMKRIFISSVQLEFAKERKLLKRYIAKNPAITKEELFEEHSSYTNNILIADQLYQTKHIEKFGTGFTDLLDDCRTAGLKTPIVDDSKSEFTVTLFRPFAPKTKEGQIKAKEGQIRDADIITIIQKYPNSSITDLATELKVSFKKIRGRIEQFKHIGILRRKGGRRYGRWEMTERFHGCNADGSAIIEEYLTLEPELELKLQKIADARGVPMSIVVSQLLKEQLNRGFSPASSL